MTILGVAERWEAAGRMDGHAIVWEACRADADGTQIIVHGDHLSPSWRALPHGESVYEIEGKGYETASEVYMEAFDRVIEDHNSVRDDGRSLSWDEGNLFLTESES